MSREDPHSCHSSSPDPVRVISFTPISLLRPSVPLFSPQSAEESSSLLTLSSQHGRPAPKHTREKDCHATSKITASRRIAACKNTSRPFMAMMSSNVLSLVVSIRQSWKSSVVASFERISRDCRIVRLRSYRDARFEPRGGDQYHQTQAS